MNGYVCVPAALAAAKVSDGAVRVYLLLATLAGRGQVARVSQKELARRAGCSRTSVRKYLAELRSAGWIKELRGRAYVLPRAVARTPAAQAPAAAGRREARTPAPKGTAAAVDERKKALIRSLYVV